MRLAHGVKRLSASLAVTSLALAASGSATPAAAQGAGGTPPADERSLSYR